MKKELLKIGDVVWVKLRGDEASHIQNGVRPCVIIQNNKGNYYSPTIVVIPLTSRKTKSNLPTHVQIPAGIAGLSKDSIAQCEGVRTISKSDIIGSIGKMPDEYLAKLSIAMLINTPIIKFLNFNEMCYIYEELTIS